MAEMATEPVIRAVGLGAWPVNPAATGRDNRLPWRPAA